MLMIRYFMSFLLATLFLSLMLFNGYVFIAGLLLKKQTPSWIPMIGGLAGLLAIVAWPGEGAKSLWWLPLVLDWGSIPGVAHALGYHAIRSIKNRSQDE